MPISKATNYLLLFAIVLFVGCNHLENNNKKANSKHLPKYKLVNDWPQLPKNFPISHVSAVSIDTSQNIFIIQRTGREWKDTMPDSLISSNTIFLFDKETGTVANSWGANLFIMPHSITVDKMDNIWVTDVGLHQVFKFSHEGKLLMKLGIAKTPGNDSVHFNRPTDVGVASDGTIYVSDGYRNSRIVKFSKEGKYLLAWGKRGGGPGEFNVPHSVSVDSHGNVYIADRENNRIQKFDANGSYLKQWKNNEATLLLALYVDKADRIFAVDDLYVNDSLPMGDDILIFDSQLTLITRFGRNDSSIAPSSLLHDISVDKEENIYVADIFGRKVQKFKKK